MAYTDVEFKFRKIGRNVQIGRNVYFRYPDLVEIGDNVIIDDFGYFTTALTIGSFVHIGPHCSVIGGRSSRLIVNDFATISARCSFACGSDSYAGDGMTSSTVPKEYLAKTTYSTVEMKKHSILGTGVVVHPAVTIEEGVAVGSMTLVTESLEPWGIYVGIPARRIRERPSDVILGYEAELRQRIAEGTL